MFKKGQKVRVVKDYPGWLKKGEVVEVARNMAVSPLSVFCPSRANQIGGFCASCFEPLNEKPESDKELADRTRSLREQYVQCINELRKRCYSVKSDITKEPILVHQGIEISKLEKVTI